MKMILLVCVCECTIRLVIVVVVVVVESVYTLVVHRLLLRNTPIHHVCAHQKQLHCVRSNVCICMYMYIM